MPYDGASLKYGYALMAVRTRFAPSPTGYLHVGGARTALYSWLYARRYGGAFVLRIEDTDLERSTPESVEAIIESMQWLGLDWDEGPYFQTERFDRYRAVISELLDSGNAYHCYCSKGELEEMRAAQLARKEKPRYDRRCLHRPKKGTGDVQPVVRFKNPTEGQVVVEDQIKGRVVFQNSELDDLIIARSDGTPTYNFTVVVDDRDMQISHVIRGDDHLNNTPRQINMLLALGAHPPIYAHVPMILGPDGSRLSKRHGAVSVLQYRDEGYLPDALLNYLVRLGWSHGDQEIFSREEMVQLFDIHGVNGAPAAFNPEKLLWLNQQYLKSADSELLGTLLEPFLIKLGIEPVAPSPAAVAAAQRERAKTLVEMATNSVFFYQSEVALDPAAQAKHLGSSVSDALVQLRDRLESLAHWSETEIHAALEEVAETSGLTFGKLSQAVRVAVAGRPVSPPIDITVCILGRERALQRLDRAMAAIAS